MADPTIPNYNSGAGRLATDRFTYQEHITGLDDRHRANQIDLFPTVVIGTEKSTVQDAISAISLVIGTPPADASTSVKGIVRLAGDIAGTATNVVVTKLQGKPVSSLTPTSGDVLTWDGSTWKPQSITGSFSNLTVTGNTTLGTNSSNTLVVNAQATLSNNLTVNGNTALGNAASDSTIIQGILGVSGGAVSIIGTSSATFGASSAVTLSGGTTTSITGGTSISLSSGTVGVTSSTLTLNGNSTTIPSTVTNLNISAINTYFSGSVNLQAGSFNIYPATILNLAQSATFTVQGNIVMSGTGKMNKKWANGQNFNASIYPALYDVYLATSAIMTANRIWTINETLYSATLQGLEFDIVNKSLYNITVNPPSGGSIAVVFPNQGATFYRTASSWAMKWRFDLS